MEEAHRRVDGLRDPERVVPPRELPRPRRRARPRAPRSRGAASVPSSAGRRVAAASSRANAGAEPLAVRRVAALEQEREAHHVADEPRGDDARAELVADLRGATDERLLLVDAAPLAREQPEPDVVRVPRERCPHGGRARRAPSWKTAPAVTSSKRCCGAQSQSPRRDPPRGSNPSRSREPRAELGHLDVVRDGDRRPSRTASASRGTRPAGRVSTASRTGATSPASTNTFSRGPQPWSVERSVSKPSTSEPEPMQRRRMPPSREQRRDDLFVVRPRELEARDEARRRQAARSSKRRTTSSPALRT